MAKIVTSVKNTFVHVDVDSSDCVDMGGNARRRASSAPARVTFDPAENEKYNTHAFGAQGSEELLLLPHDEDDYSCLHAHPGPSPFDMDVEGMLGCHVLETDVDDHYYCGLSSLQAKDETKPDLVSFHMDIDDRASEEMEDCSASASALQCWTYGAQLPSAKHRVQPCMSAALMTPHKPAQRELFSTVPILPHEEQRSSCLQSHSGNSLANVLCNATPEETQGEEKRTTIMLMNVPRRYTSSKLMHTIDSLGFASMYDFIYVPMTVARNSKGYAFVNWVSPSVAQRFLNAFDGFSSWTIESKNVSRAVWAKQHQGLQVNIERYRNSTVLGKSVPDEFKPRIFKNGVEIPFPMPSRKPSKSKPTRRAEQPRTKSS